MVSLSELPDVTIMVAFRQLPHAAGPFRYTADKLRSQYNKAGLQHRGRTPPGHDGCVHNQFKVALSGRNAYLTALGRAISAIFATLFFGDMLISNRNLCYSFAF